MPARPRVSYEKKGELFDLAEDIKPTEANKERSFSEALDVVLGYVDPPVDEGTDDTEEIETLLGESQQQGGSIGTQQNQSGPLNQRSRF